MSEAAQTNTELMTIKDLISFLGWSSRTVIRKIKSGELPPPAVGTMRGRSVKLWSRRGLMDHIDKQQRIRIRAMERRIRANDRNDRVTATGELNPNS